MESGGVTVQDTMNSTNVAGDQEGEGLNLSLLDRFLPVWIILV